jgi:hypothetical protein
MITLEFAQKITDYAQKADKMFALRSSHYTDH